MVEKQDFEALIVRYLEGIATPEEAMQLEDWKNESSDNQQLYERYERLFSENGRMIPKKSMSPKEPSAEMRRLYR